MKIRVVYSTWGADGFDEPLAGGDHDLEAVTDVQARSIAGAAAAGAVEVLDASAAEKKLLQGHVQSQEDGEKALAAAQGDWDPDAARWSGPWHEGNLHQFVVGRKGQLAEDDRLRADEQLEGARLTDDERAQYEREVVQAEAAIAAAQAEEVPA